MIIFLFSSLNICFPDFLKINHLIETVLLKTHLFCLNNLITNTYYTITSFPNHKMKIGTNIGIISIKLIVNSFIKLGLAAVRYTYNRLKLRRLPI